MALRPDVIVPPKKLARMELLVHVVLDLDLEPFVAKGRGMCKPSLPLASLQSAAGIWRAYHPMSSKDDLKGLQPRESYTVLWQTLKRRVLVECGLRVLPAASRRVYFEGPHESATLAPADHASVKEGNVERESRRAHPVRSRRGGR